MREKIMRKGKRESMTIGKKWKIWNLEWQSRKKLEKQERFRRNNLTENGEEKLELGKQDRFRRNNMTENGEQIGHVGKM